MIKWQEKYTTGLKEVDDQHKILFVFFNDFEESIKESRGMAYIFSYFSVLEAYAVAHFQYEEECMEKYRCPAAEVNKIAHQKFIENVVSVRAQLESKQFTDEQAAQLHQFLEQWITGHIIGTDAQLRPCVHRNP